MKRPYKIHSIESTFNSANRNYKPSYSTSQAERLIVKQQRCTFDLMLLLHDEITKLVTEIVSDGATK